MSGPNDTIWSPGNREGEYSPGGSSILVDNAGFQLADSSGNLLADDGTVFTPVPLTIWTTNDTG